METFQHSKVFVRYPSLKVCEEAMVQALEALTSCYRSGGKLLVMGNGGSSSDAEHLCAELMKGFKQKRALTETQRSLFAEAGFADYLQGALPAISLGVSHALISAHMNDVHPDFIFAQQIWGLGCLQDVVLGISTSGNSKNIVNGFKVAGAKKIKTIVLTGKNPSRCSELADIVIHAPAVETFEVQELHLPIYHALCIELESVFFPLPKA